MNIRRFFFMIVAMIVIMLAGFEARSFAQEPESALIHDVYTPTSEILQNFKTRCTEKGIDFDEFRWVGPQEPFAFTDDPEVVVVLDVTLDSLQTSFEFAWEWTKEGQEASWRWDGFETTPDKLRLLQGAETFQSMTLRWRRIKLNTNIGEKTVDVRSPEASPGLALIFVAAQHPARVKATDYKTRFGWYVPGLECTASIEPWQYVPCVGFGRDDRHVELRALWYGRSHAGLAAPVFQE